MQTWEQMSHANYLFEMQNHAFSKKSGLHATPRIYLNDSLPINYNIHHVIYVTHLAIELWSC